LGVGYLFDQEYILAPWSWDRLRNFLWHLWPVVVIVGTANIAALIRYMRANLLDVLGAALCADRPRQGALRARRHL
jgi:peptide/nickel transport system permease protein